MSAALSPAEAIALQVLQQATGVLARWADPAFDPPVVPDAESPAILRAKALIGWSDAAPAPLRLVFDCIQLNHTQSNQHYRPAWAIGRQNGEKYPRIPYAQPQPPSTNDLQKLKAGIQTALDQLQRQWHNPAQLTVFLEKFGSHLSLGDSDVALIDLTRSTAAVAAALAQTPTDETLALIGGDLMGVQKFIYTISSEGALKSLRARSFFLELATEEVVQQILDALQLPRINVIYAGASKFYILAAATDRLSQLQDIQTRFNAWLLDTFQRKVFLAIAHTAFPATALEGPQSAPAKSFAQIWQQVNHQLSNQATRKFAQHLETLLTPQSSHQPCRVCHRDDVPEEQLKPLKDEADPTLACPICRQMYQLGDQLPEVKAWVRSPRRHHDHDLAIQSVFYHAVGLDYRPSSGETVFNINNWDLVAYPSNQFAPMLLGNYFQQSPETNGFLSASEMAEKSSGIQRVGYLRMDVDRLSQIFSNGLGTKYTLPRLASLSRQMTYFFKVYLNSLAQARTPNLVGLTTDADQPRFRFLTPAGDRPNLLFIYAGGDDLFISGAWNEIVEFAFDVYQAFRAYTGYHPSITLSGGISIAGPKFPLYQAAQEAGEAEDAAKDNGRDSLSLFGQTFKWQQWLGIQAVEEDSRDFLATETMPELLGVLPFVKTLLDPQGLDIGYPQSFIRNLLITAQLREQKIQEIRQTHPDQEMDATYYLHLPKLAYALSRLPSQISNHDTFKPVRRSLMSPRNSPYFRAIATWIELLTRQ